MKTVLSKRLRELVALAPLEHTTYYDLFCDHGLLGIELLNRFPQGHIVFNDKSQNVAKSFREKTVKGHYHFNSCPAEELSLEKNAWVFMAGVGGLLIKNCLSAWMKSHSPEHFHSLSFVLSPHYYQTELRDFLFQNGFNVKKEKIIEEKGRYYEVLVGHFCKTHSQKIALFSKDLWLKEAQNRPSSVERFLGKQLKNYKQKRHKNPSDLFVLESIKEVLSGIKPPHVDL